MSELRSLTLLSAAHNRLTMLPTGLGQPPTPTPPPPRRPAARLLSAARRRLADPACLGFRQGEPPAPLPLDAPPARRSCHGASPVREPAGRVRTFGAGARTPPGAGTVGSTTSGESVADQASNTPLQRGGRSRAAPCRRCARARFRSRLTLPMRLSLTWPRPARARAPQPG